MTESSIVCMVKAYPTRPFMPRVPSADIAAVRRFNRFFTRSIGALDEGHLGSPFSLTEMRVLYELAHRSDVTARDLVRDLGLDEGYVSRMLARFAKAGYLRREPSRTDARFTLLSLTARGRSVFAPLGAAANKSVGNLLNPLTGPTRESIVRAMHEIQLGLGGVRPQAESVVLRQHRPGDLGWIVHRHGALYAAEYGYDARFEAIVAEVAADFLRRHDPRRERCWIAEHGSVTLGSVLLVKKSATVAKLRLLYLEPAARGMGLGRRLVDECLAFARTAGYRKVTLWTQSSLTAARHIYEARGFQLVGSKMHSDFGPREAAETWELALK